MKARIIQMFAKFVNTRICTSEEFMKACETAKDEASRDKDGFLTVWEACKIIVKTIRARRQEE